MSRGETKSAARDRRLGGGARAALRSQVSHRKRSANCSEEDDDDEDEEDEDKDEDEEEEEEEEDEEDGEEDGEDNRPKCNARSDDEKAVRIATSPLSVTCAHASTVSEWRARKVAATSSRCRSPTAAH